MLVVPPQHAMKTETIKFYCTNCKNGIEAENEDIGYQVKCPTCHSSVVVPATSHTASQNPNRPRWGLVAIGLLLGLLMLICGMMALSSQQSGRKVDVTEVMLDLCCIFYGAALFGSGAFAVWSERKQSNAPIAAHDGKPKAPKCTVIFAVVCVSYGWLAGWIFAWPGFVWGLVGAILGAVGGTVGAGYCLLVLKNEANSMPRQIHGCIFITLVTLLFSMLASRLRSEEHTS